MSKPAADFILGIDIGGTNTVFGLVNEAGKIHNKGHLPTEHFLKPEDLIKSILDVLQSWKKQGLINTMPQLAGIGAPNAGMPDSIIDNPPNLKWKGKIPFGKLFTEITGINCVLTNDANASALGELHYGSRRKIKNFVYVTLGTGLGCGIVMNGELVTGINGFAGELGHTIIMQHGRMCGCGRRGCLEQYCSANGLVKSYLEILKNSGSEIYQNVINDPPDAEGICSRALAGDEAAFYSFKYTGELLGLALANSVAYTSPEAVFLAGELSDSGELLMAPLIQSFERNLFHPYKSTVKLMRASFDAKESAILGAAALAKKELIIV